MRNGDGKGTIHGDGDGRFNAPTIAVASSSLSFVMSSVRALRFW